MHEESQDTLRMRLYVISQAAQIRLPTPGADMQNKHFTYRKFSTPQIALFSTKICLRSSH